MAKCGKKKAAAKPAAKKLENKDLKGIAGGLELGPTLLSPPIAKPFVPGGAVLDSAIPVIKGRTGG